MKNLSWLTTFLCMFYCMRCATAFLLHHARLFTAAALLSLGWALVLTYYNAIQPVPETLTGFAAYLTVYSAAIVIRDCKGTGRTVSVLERWSLGLLGTVMTGLSIPFVSIPHSSSEIVVATCLYAVGDAAICWAIWWLAPTQFFVATIALFVTYLGFEVLYAYRYLTLGAATAMTPYLTFAFAVCKILMTAIYMSLIVRRGLSATHRKLRWWQLIMVFCKIPLLPKRRRYQLSDSLNKRHSPNRSTVTDGSNGGAYGGQAERLRGK